MMIQSNATNSQQNWVFRIKQLATVLCHCIALLLRPQYFQLAINEMQISLLRQGRLVTYRSSCRSPARVPYLSNDIYISFLMSPLHIALHKIFQFVCLQLTRVFRIRSSIARAQMYNCGRERKDLLDCCKSKDTHYICKQY